MAKKELNPKNFHEGSIDDIINYVSAHRGKPFKERMAAFEAFHDPHKHMEQRLGYHADYVINGHPSDSKLPGAYNLAHKELDNIAKSDYEKITDKKDLDKVVNAFVDEMLKQAVGQDRMNEAIKKLKKKGWDDERIQEFKGRMFGNYFKDERGNSMNPYSLSRTLRGKKKIEIKGELKRLANDTQKAYMKHVDQKITSSLVNPYDVLDMADYVQDKFDKKGLDNDLPHLALASPYESAAHYERLIKGEDLKGLGYKAKKKPAA